VRIYKEQFGGSHQVAIDRKQRRERMKATLSRMQKDTAVSPDLAVWLKQPPLNWKK